MKDKNYDTCWLCWHGESNSYIWHLEKNEDILTFDIWNGISSFGLPYEGKESKKVVLQNDILFKTETSYYCFLVTLYETFLKYSYEKGLKEYEQGTYQFPKKEFHELKRYLYKEF